MSPEEIIFHKMWYGPEGFVYKNSAFPFETVTSMKVLGVHIDQSFCFRSHANSIITSCISRMGILRRLSKSNWGLEARLIGSAYKALIQSRILYALPTFGPYMVPECFRDLDIRVVHVASRLATGLNITCRNEAHLLLSGLLPSRTLLIRRCAVLLDKVVRNPSIRVFEFN